MYIFELIAQVFKKKNYNKTTYDPLDIVSGKPEDDSQDCEHLFLPLDSTNTMFACKYCGLIVPREKLKNKNIFENKPF